MEGIVILRTLIVFRLSNSGLKGVHLLPQLYLSVLVRPELRL